MAKSAFQKLKLLYLMDYFLEFSDEDHLLTVPDMISHLEKFGINAERKSIYNDIEALNTYGLDIVKVKGKTTGYYVASRKFELAELKILVDSVQSSKFITHKKTASLIKKLESLTSTYEAVQLQRQVYISNRVKRDNESVYYNIDAIHRAISENRKITFKYFEYSIKKEKVLKKSGEKYVVSPIALLWDDENYYLVAFDSGAGMVKHYRCDKMIEIDVSDEEKDAKELYNDLDMATYSKKVFGMFSGREEKVRIRFENNLVGAAIDRFGKDISLISDGEDHFIINVNVAVSPQFFGWILGLGTGAEIIAPESTVCEMREYIKNIYSKYCEEKQSCREN